MTQEAFLAAWKGLGRFDLSQPFKPWLLRIVVNCCISYKRKARVATAQLDEPVACAIADHAPLPEQVALQRELQLAVRAALDSLDEEQRLTLILRYFADMSISEIAGALSCPEGTVKSRLHRALPRLRDQLSPRPALPVVLPLGEYIMEDGNARG